MRTLILATAASAVVLSGCQTVDTTKSTAVGVDRPQHMLVSSEQINASAGYDPHAAISLWEKMQKLGGSQPPQFLSTHPSHESRINDLRAYAEKVTPLYQAAKPGGSSTAGK